MNNILINSKIVTNGKIIKNKNLIFNDTILRITDALPEDVQIIDGKGYYASAGFIDQHIHGAGGMDTMDASYEALDIISRSIVKTGTTYFLPTTMTMGWNQIVKALCCIKEYMGKEKGAKILGAHLEGPFINPKFKGAQREDSIIQANFKLVEDYLDIVKLITYAPECDENLEFTKSILNHSKVVLSIGHSDCTMDLALEIHDLGVKNITHCFHGMNGLHHRLPGVIGAMLINDYIIEYVADGIHSDIRMLRGFIDKCGKDKAILITDAMRASLLSNGEFDLGGQMVTVSENSARLADGTLAGSILGLNQAVKNVISNDISLPEAIAMVTENPAKSLGVFDKLGSIEEGKSASIVLFNDNIEIKKVFIEGMEVI